MITNKIDLKYYICEDCKRYISISPPSIKQIIMSFLFENNAMKAYKYMRTLRHFEYYLNARHGFIGSLACAFYKWIRQL